jgi:NitT/TauT family transport system permease protein
MGMVNTMLLPPFSEVVLSIEGLLVKGNLLTHIYLSLGRALSGFFIAVLTAIPAGIVMGGLSRRFQLAMEPLVEFLSQLNPFVLYHLILIFMGIGEATKTTIIAWACIWPLLFSTISGVGNIDPLYIKSANTFKLSRWQMAIKILLPGAMPQIMYGIRLSASYSLFMLIAAEMMGAESGLGFLIVLSQRYYQIKNVYATVVIIALLGVLIDAAINLVERKMLFHYLQEESNG